MAISDLELGTHLRQPQSYIMSKMGMGSSLSSCGSRVLVRLTTAPVSLRSVLPSSPRCACPRRGPPIGLGPPAARRTRPRRRCCTETGAPSERCQPHRLRRPPPAGAEPASAEAAARGTSMATPPPPGSKRILRLTLSGKQGARAGASARRRAFLDGHVCAPRVLSPLTSRMHTGNVCDNWECACRLP